MKNVILTGISKGLGRSLLRGMLLLRDVRVFGVGRNFPSEEGEGTYARIHWDLEKPKDMPSLPTEVVKAPLVLLNNAGTVEPIGSIGTLSHQALRRAIQVNFLSPMLLCNQFVQLCHKNRQKLKIINISTGAANVPIVGWGAYCSTKAAFKMFFDVLKQQEKDGAFVEIVHVDPGVMDTAMQEKIRAADADDFPRVAEFQDFQAKGKLRSPEEVAQSIIREHIL